MRLPVRSRAIGIGRASIVGVPKALRVSCACTVVLLAGCGSLPDSGRPPSTPYKGTNVWDVASADVGAARPRPLDR